MTLTAINFVHVSGRSLYIFRMARGGGGRGKCPNHVKGRGNCPGGGNVLGNMSGVDMSRGKCPYPGHVIRSPAIAENSGGHISPPCSRLQQIHNKSYKWSLSFTHCRHCCGSAAADWCNDAGDTRRTDEIS